MHIFVDESGLFVPSATGSGVSAVGSLVIPECHRARIERKYAGLRPSLPMERGEVKSRKMSETQIAAVADILRKNDALLEIVAIDLNTHTEADIEDHKRGQAAGVTRGMTEQHHPNLRKSAEELAARIEVLSNQLYVQGLAMIELVAHTIEHATNYFSQRQPKELAEFRWVVDGKGISGPTNWEALWHTMVSPILQSRSMRAPMGMFEDGDYSHFKRFEGTRPDWLPRPVDWDTDDGVTDIKLIMNEHFRNSSAVEPGLELADIVVSAVRRAMAGNLRQGGWSALPPLMIHRKSHYIHLIALHDREPTELPSYTTVLNGFRRGGRTMLSPRFWLEERRKG